MSLVWGLLLGLAAYGFGCGLLAALRTLDRDGADRAADLGAARFDALLACGLGVWVVATAALALGLGGWLARGPIGAGLLAPGIALALRLGRPCRRAEGGPWTPFEAAVAGLIGLIALGNLARALAPATAWDAVAYHLADARIFAAAGRFIDVPSIRQARWPQGLDALYAVAEGLQPRGPAGVVAWLLGLLAIAAVFGLGSSCGGRRAGVVAAAVFTGAPVVVLLSGMAYVEAGLAALVALMLLAIRQHIASGRRSDLIAAGLLAGAVAAVKYSALIYPALAAAVLLSSGARRWRSACSLLAVAGVAAAPWYLRTLHLTGNPLWPYLYGWLGGADWSAFHAERLLAFERGYGPGAGWLNLVAAPWWLTFEPARYDGLQLGPAFLALAPFAFTTAWHGRRGLLLFCGLGGIVWFGLTQQVRFLVPLLPAACALIAVGIDAPTWPRAARVGRAVVVAVLLLGLVPLAGSVRDRVPVLLGRESTDRYLTRQLTAHRAVRFINDTLRPRRLLLFREVRGYYLDVPYVWGDPVTQVVIDYRRLADAAALRARLLELRIDAVLINANHYPPSEGYYDARTLALMEQMVADHCELVFIDGGVRVYRLLDP